MGASRRAGELKACLKAGRPEGRKAGCSGGPHLGRGWTVDFAPRSITVSCGPVCVICPGSVPVVSSDLTRGAITDLKTVHARAIL